MSIVKFNFCRSQGELYVEMPEIVREYLILLKMKELQQGLMDI